MTACRSRPLNREGLVSVLGAISETLGPKHAPGEARHHGPIKRRPTEPADDEDAVEA